MEIQEWEELTERDFGYVRHVMGRREILDSFPDVLQDLREKQKELEEEEKQRLIKVAREKERFRKKYTRPEERYVLEFMFSVADKASFPQNPALKNIENWISLMSTDTTKKHDIKKAKEESDIFEVAACFTKVDVGSGRGKCLCPFHPDRSPSLVLYPSNTYHCFACGANGDVIDLVMQFNSCSFLEALKFIHEYGKSDNSSPRTRRGDR